MRRLATTGGAAGAGLLLLTLAACGSKTVTAENASVAEVAAKVKASGLADKPLLTPGHWDMTMTVREMTMPGLPPQMAARMHEAMGKPKTFGSCVTPEQAKRPSEDFFSGAKQANCKYAHFNMGDGVIDMALVCTPEAGMKQTMTMKGTYAADTYSMSLDSKVEGGRGPMNGMTMKADMEGRHTGACTGKEPGGEAR